MIETEQVIASSGQGVETVTGVGELTLYCAEQFREALSNAVASGNEIIVDFRQASYMDTAIIAALISPARALLGRGGRLKVLLIEGGYPQHVLKTVGFGDIIDIVAEKSGASSRPDSGGK